MTRKMITVRDSLSHYNLDGLSVAQAIEYFENLRLKYGNDAIVELQVNEGDPYDSYPSIDFCVKFQRIETDKEHKKRNDTERRMKKGELALLEKLKKKYKK